MSSNKVQRATKSRKKNNESLKAPETTTASPGLRWTLSLILAGLGVWAYFPSVVEMVEAWSAEADYSHGYLVLPAAAMFLWIRKDDAPAASPGPHWGAFALFSIAIGVRLAGAWFYLGSVDAWSIPIWVGGIVWLLWGRSVLFWALPAILFLYFMIPVPFRAERLMSHPLQTVATKLSTGTLQTLGLPAIAEGHTILVNDHAFEVEQACSGLRVFFGTFALAFATSYVSRLTWWESLILLVATVPIALFANAFRIVLTAILAIQFSGETASAFSHDFAGWVMILVSASIFAMFVTYLRWMIPIEEEYDVATMLNRPQGQA